MAIPIQCPECHKKYQAPDHMAGKRVKCKYCAVIFLIAADARSADAGVDISALDELNALGETGKREAFKREGAGTTVAAGDDIDSIFQSEYASDGAPRTNKLYVFPLSRLLDRWLPPVLLVVGLFWAVYEAFERNNTNRPWVGFFRACVFVLAFFASAFPFTLMGVRSASLKLNYELPPSPGLRIMGAYAVPFALACAMWLVLGGVSGLLIGVLIGCIVALPVVFLLFRLVPAEAPVTFGYVTGFFVLSIVVSVAAVFALNLMLVGSLRATKIDHALSSSPFGPDFKWDAPAERMREQLVENTGQDAEFSANEEAQSDSRPPTIPATTPAVVTTVPSTRATVADVTPAGPSEPTKRDVIPPLAGAAKAPMIGSGGPKLEPEKAVDANAGRVERARGLIAEVRVGVPGVFKQIIYPAVPGSRIAVVRDGRPGHDRVELWDTSAWKKGAEIEIPRAPEGNRYSLGPDGEYLCFPSDFPRLAIQVYSFSLGRLHRAVELDPADGQPLVLGFIAPEQLLLLKNRDGDTLLQVWNARSGGRGRAFPIPAFEPDPRHYTISPDGSAIAFIVQGAGGADLESYALATGRPIKQMPIVEVDPGNATVAALAYSSDGQRIAAVFANGRGAGFFVAWPATGRGGRAVSQQLLPVGVNAPEPPHEFGAALPVFEGRPIHWLDKGSAWLLFGESVFDTASGALLGSLNQQGVRSQSADSAGDACYLVARDDFGSIHLFVLRLDLEAARQRAVPARVPAPARETSG